MTTLASLDNRITTLETKTGDLVGKFYLLRQKMDRSHILTYARYFEDIISYFKLEKGVVYALDVLLENKNGSGQITSDVTVQITTSADHNPRNLDTANPVISNTKTNAVIPPNQSVVINFKTIAIPTAANFMELYVAVNIQALNPGDICVSVHLFKEQVATRTLVGSFTPL